MAKLMIERAANRRASSMIWPTPSTRAIQTFDVKEIIDAMKSGVYGATTIVPVPPWDGENYTRTLKMETDDGHVLVNGIKYRVLASVRDHDDDELIAISRPKGSKEYLARRLPDSPIYGENRAQILAPFPRRVTCRSDSK